MVIGRRAALGMFALTIVACAPTTPAPSPAPASSGSSAQPTASGPVKVTFWHAMGGNNGKIVDELVKRFNDSQNKYIVEAVFQGTYDDALDKLRAGLPGGNVPSIIQVYEIGSRFMIDSKATTPVQQFIDEDKYSLTDFETNVLNYYTFDGKLNSFPFNSSNPILYFNKNAFREAGLDPEKPPKTYEEIVDAAKKLTVRDSAGQITRPGLSMAIYGWFYEQLRANQNVAILNNGNGRDGLATAATVNSPEGVKTLQWWADLTKDGSNANLGRATAETQKAFIAGKIAMTLDSTAALRGVIDGAGSNFEVGTSFLPRPAGTNGGVVIGGASLWMMKARPAAEQRGAWEFMKFVADPQQQGYWHINTGYFPVRKSSYDRPEVAEWRKKYPQFGTAVEQLRASQQTKATQGAVMGVFPQARQIVESAIEEVLLGKSSPKDALDKANSDINSAIDTYNKTVTR